MQIKLEMTKEHAKKCKCFGDPKHCLLATALRARFPRQKILAGYYYHWVGSKRFIISSKSAGRILSAYRRDHSAVRANFKPFAIRLTAA